MGKKCDLNFSITAHLVDATAHITHLVDARGQRRIGQLIQGDRRATLTEITTRYNRGMQQNICEATTHTTLRWMGYNSTPSSPKLVC